MTNVSKKLLVFVFVILLLLSPVTVFAVEEASEETATAVEPTVGAKKTPVRDAMKANKEVMKDKIATAKEEFRTKLATIKDERKKTVVENIDSKIAGINERRTTQFSEHLAKLTGIIDRISSKEAVLKTEGKDTAKLMAAIVAAKSAISKAQAANDAQKAKTYTANITTDELLKSAIGATLNQFQTDLRAVFNLVKAARSAVMAASLEIKNLSVPKSDKVSTITPSVSPTETP